MNDDSTGFTIRGVDFSDAGFPRLFNMAEREIVQRIYNTDKEFAEAQALAMSEADDGKGSSGGRAREKIEERLAKELLKPWGELSLEKVEKYVERGVALGGFESGYRGDVVAALDSLLETEYDSDPAEWDDEAISSLTGVLAAQEGLEDAAKARDLARVTEGAQERLEAAERMLRIQERVNLHICWEVGKYNHLKVGPWKTFGRVADATDDDHNRANALVVEGKRYASLERSQRSQQLAAKRAFSAFALTQPDSAPEESPVSTPGN